MKFFKFKNGNNEHNFCMEAKPVLALSPAESGETKQDNKDFYFYKTESGEYCWLETLDEVRKAIDAKKAVYQAKSALSSEDIEILEAPEVKAIAYNSKENNKNASSCCSSVVDTLCITLPPVLVVATTVVMFKITVPASLAIAALAGAPAVVSGISTWLFSKNRDELSLSVLLDNRFVKWAVPVVAGGVVLGLTAAAGTTDQEELRIPAAMAGLTTTVFSTAMHGIDLLRR